MVHNKAKIEELIEFQVYFFLFTSEICKDKTRLAIRQNEHNGVSVAKFGGYGFQIRRAFVRTSSI